MQEQIMYEVINSLYEEDEEISNATIKKHSYYIKSFIKDNPEHHYTKLIKLWFIDLYKKQFNNPKFKDALNIPKTQKYRRIQEVILNFPLKWENESYRYNFYHIFEINSTLDFWIDCINFLKENNYDISEDLISKIKEFLDENDRLVKTSKNQYNDINYEKNLYRLSLLNVKTQEYKAFEEKNNINIYNGYDYLTMYQNKLIGNIGEMYIYDKIKYLPNAIFTSRDLGDKFGYDIYYQTYNDNQLIENLVEVKSTTNISGSDSIIISDNEYNVMKNTLNEENTNYYICRVFIDINNPEYEHHYFRFENGILKSQTCDIEYELKMIDDNKYIFKRKENTRVRKTNIS